MQDAFLLPTQDGHRMGVLTTQGTNSKRIFNLQRTRLEDGQASCPKNAKACPCCSDEIYPLLLSKGRENRDQ